MTRIVRALPSPLIAMVTDRHRYGISAVGAIERLVLQAVRVARAGVDLIQVRERDLDDRSLVDLVGRIVTAVSETSARVLINERTDVALAAGAHGVHLRSTSPAASRVRSIVSDQFIIGRSVHAPTEAIAAERDGGCDYLVFGTVFQSSSKPAEHPIAGLEALEQVCAAVRLPVLAIGGITENRTPEAARAGAAGVAAIRLFAGDAADDERDFRQMIVRIRSAFNRKLTRDQ